MQMLRQRVLAPRPPTARPGAAERAILLDKRLKHLGLRHRRQKFLRLARRVVDEALARKQLDHRRAPPALRLQKAALSRPFPAPAAPFQVRPEVAQHARDEEHELLPDEFRIEVAVLRLLIRRR